MTSRPSLSSCMILLFAMMSPSLAKADVVFGSIYFEERQLSNEPIEILCGAEKYEGRLGERGEYRIFVKTEGKCELRIEIQGRHLAAEVRSYDEPVRYDFAIINSPEGYRLERK